MPITNEERIGVVETELKEVRADVHQIQQDIRELRNDLADRPSWGVAKVIAGLSFIAAAATSTLATLLITLAQ
jgi:hypothetical protein